ncbi:MAG: AMP-binding protein, partial [Proteobacteria bacterium]|nr:AMP-binding protein [Pseudomonadota bacterium]
EEMLRRSVPIAITPCLFQIALSALQALQRIVHYLIGLTSLTIHVNQKFRTLMKKAGLQKGDRVAVIANNSVEFALTAYAAYGLGGIIVPMYEFQKLQDWEFIFSDSKPMLAVVGNDSIREKIEGLQCDSLKQIYVINPSDHNKALSELISLETEFTEITDDLNENDICDIIYTSGTTGRPRGVVLRHKNVVENVKSTTARFSIGPNDRLLTFLPWAHAFGKTVELHLFPAIGAALGLAESTRTIQDDLREINPTILNSVPKIFCKIYDKIHLMMENSKSKRFLLEYTENIAQKNKAGSASLLDKMQFAILDKAIAAKVRAAFGNSLRFCISGGASLSPKVMQFFDNFGVTIYEGYGMTEHAPIVSVNNPTLRKVGSVGRALPNVKIEILHDNENIDQSDDKCGEIVVTSDSVMKEYYNDPNATNEAIDEQGRLHTGDMGYLDDDGCLWITGRVKEQYKLENGKYVVPTALEDKINNSTMISQAVIFGAGKPYNIVLIRPADELIAKFREENNLKDASQAELESNPKLRELIYNELQSICADFRGYEKPQKFTLVLDDFTIENGLITPALKIKRREIEKRFADKIAALYE